MASVLIKSRDATIFENKTLVLSIKRHLLNEKLKISEILFLKKVYSMTTKPDSFPFSVHDFLNFLFGFI